MELRKTCHEYVADAADCATDHIATPLLNLDLLRDSFEIDFLKRLAIY